MVQNEIEHVGLSVALEAQGYYTVTLWFHLRGGGRMQDEAYRALTWAEVLDVIDAGLAQRRPGFAFGDGWTQEPLFDPAD